MVTAEGPSWASDFPDVTGRDAVTVGASGGVGRAPAVTK